VVRAAALAARAAGTVTHAAAAASIAARGSAMTFAVDDRVVHPLHVSRDGGPSRGPPVRRGRHAAVTTKIALSKGTNCWRCRWRGMPARLRRLAAKGELARYRRPAEQPAGAPCDRTIGSGEHDGIRSVEVWEPCEPGARSFVI